MTEGEARELIALRAGAAEDPPLDEVELETLVQASRAVDPAGLAPRDAGWLPTFDVEEAVLAGLRLKLLKAASNFSFSTDGQTFQRHQVREGLLQAVEIQERRVMASPRVKGSGR